MTDLSPPYEELTRLISALLDRDLTEPERARLEARLQTDAQARRLYMQMVDQEIELSCLQVAGTQEERAGKILPLLQPGETKATELASGRRPRWLAAAAILVLATAMATVVFRNRPGAGSVPQPSPPRAESLSDATWSEGFEQGLPPGWTGRLVSTNLPAGSKHGVAAGPRQSQDGVYHAIQLPEDWNRGLFALSEDSTLHITYRFVKGAHVNVFMHAVPADTSISTPSMFQLSPHQFPRSARQWQMASIPFSSFVRKVRSPEGRMEFIGGPPAAGERVATISFSWPEEIDFVIDRIWVTPNGSGEEKNQNTQVSHP
jgi:hypothetical protein